MVTVTTTVSNSKVVQQEPNKTKLANIFERRKNADNILAFLLFVLCLGLFIWLTFYIFNL